MRIFAYRIEQKGPRSLDVLTERLFRLPLQDRFYGPGNVRLEARQSRRGLLFLDFAKERGGHGPGKMARDAELSEIRLRQGENFGEDTAVVVDLASRYAAVQYNHFGPRTLTLEHYLYSFDLSLGGRGPAAPGTSDEDRFGFQFGALLKPDAYARLQRFGIIHDMEFTIANPGANRADLAVGRSLGQILSAPLPEGTEKITIKVQAAPRDGHLGIGVAREVIAGLRHLGADLVEAKVRGKEDPDDRLQKVDLVEERISEDVDLELGSGRRYRRPDRWQALQDTLVSWRDGGAFGGR
jgi:hypothetical protein